MKTYSLQISGRKEPIYLDQFQAEKLMLSLSGGNKPQFILVEDQLVNTSFIVSITSDPADYWKYGVDERKKLTAEENKVHQEYLKMKEKLLKGTEIIPQISA